MAKTDAILKTLRSLFTNKAPAAPAANAQPSAPVPAQPPPKPILSEQEIEKIRNSDFTKQNELFDAINAGIKIASDKQTARYSSFSYVVHERLKMYKKLKPEDFEKKTKKWNDFIRSDIFYSDYKKLVKEYSQGQDVFLYYNKEAKKAKIMIEVIKKLQPPALTVEELNYLNDHAMLSRATHESIETTLKELKLLASLPEKQRTDLYKIAEPHNEKITLEQLINIYTVFSQFKKIELPMACGLCYYDTTHYYARNPYQDCTVKDDDGDSISVVTRIIYKNPVERLQKNLKWAERQYKHYLKIGTRKPEFNKIKAQYMDAMRYASCIALGWDPLKQKL